MYTVDTSCSKLLLPLPEEVNSDKGTAQWDSKKEQLCIYLPLAREKLELL